MKKHFMLSFTSFFNKPLVKAFVLAILAILLSISFAFLGDWSPNQPSFTFKILFWGLCCFLYVTFTIFYATAEANERRLASIRQRQLSTFENLIISIISICETNANDINTCIRVVRDSNIINLNIWSFRKACKLICEHIFDNLCNLGNSKKYGVSYVQLIEDHLEDSVEMIAYANQNRHRPTVFGKKRSFINIDQKSAYFDLCMFNEAKADNYIAMGVDEVDKIFVRNRQKHHLFIGIPVFCADKKMIGLLEIVGFDDSMLGCTTKEELEEVANKFLVPYANVFLLLHKMEKALLAGTSAQ